MREIKFRCWDKAFKAFIVPIDFALNGLGNLMLTESNKLIEGNVFNGAVEADRYIVLIATGTFDIKGKEIYEGDICKVVTKINCKVTSEPKELPEMEYTEIGVMNFNEKTGRFVIELENSLLDGEYEHCRVEIIGNIYENPELLTQHTTKKEG